MNKQEKLERIRTLVCSTDRTNNLLVIEMVKNDSDGLDYLPELLCLALGVEDEEVRLEARRVIAILAPKEEAQMNFTFHRSNSVNESLYKKLQKFFPTSVVVGMAYTYFKRTGKGTADFLILDDGNSPYRKEVLAAHREKQHSQYTVELKGMFPEEIDELLDNLRPNTFGRLRMTINYLKGDDIPASVFKMKHLEILYIIDCPLKSFPERVLTLTNLKQLHFQRVSLQNIPSDWSSLSSIEHLTLDDCGLHFESFDFMHHMPMLKQANFNNATYASPYMLIAKKSYPLAAYSNFFKNFNFPNGEMLKVASAIGRSGLAIEDQYYAFDLIKNCKNISELTHPSTQRLLKMLNIRYKPLEAKCLEWLHGIIEQQDGMKNFGKKSVLSIIGKTAMRKTEIRNKLKELGIEYSAKFNIKVTHVLVGKNPMGINIEHNPGLKLILENQLQTYFSTENPQYIEEAASAGQEEISDNILEFLTSEDSSTVMVALEMLKAGGVPDNLLEELLLLQKCNPDSKVRGEAKKLLERFAPQEWAGLIKDKTTFTNILGEVKAQAINKKLEKVAKNYRSMAAFLSLLLYKRYKKGLRYILYHFKKPSPTRTQAFHAMMEGTHFNFSRGLGFKNWRNTDPDAMSLYPMKSPVPFPVDILEVVDKIESIDFHNCKFDKLHISIGKFTDLKSLDCSCNFIKSLPKTLHKLKHLEELDLSFNAFATLPEEITLLPNLKKLDLRYNRQSYQFTPVVVSPEIRAALPECEILL